MNFKAFYYSDDFLFGLNWFVLVFFFFLFFFFLFVSSLPFSVISEQIVLMSLNLGKGEGYVCCTFIFIHSSFLFVLIFKAKSHNTIFMAV